MSDKRSHLDPKILEKNKEQLEIESHNYSHQNNPEHNIHDQPKSTAQIIQESKNHKLTADDIEHHLNSGPSRENLKENLLGHEKLRASRNDLQLARRIFHIGGGLSISILYGGLLSHSQAIQILGLFACVFYLLEQIRINYPEHSKKFNPIGKFFMRAEEQLKETAMVPYLMGILLTLITFPKLITICAVLTLGLADPLSAIIGIKFGKKKIAGDKTAEGTTSFFIATFISCFFPIYLTTTNPFWNVMALSTLTSIMITSFDLLPTRIDDNLTIPLFTAICLWINGLAMGVQFF